jgi:hypothetical protein
MWLQDCLSSHQKCARFCRAPLPTRVIDVGSHGSDPHLHITTVGENDSYIALSHCWGVERPPPRTTKSNLEEMKRGLSLADLPQKFQDAITVARAFGIKYVWIDSLCIIQDSFDDWVSESARMGQIYSDSLLVLAAAAGDDSYSGFFSGNRQNIKQAKVSYCDQGNNDSCLYVRAAPLPHQFTRSHTRYSEPPPRLSTRGWTLQESLLAPRTLLYGEEEMSWECIETSQCECRLSSAGRDYIHACKVAFRRLLLRTGDFFDSWTEVVETYTRRKLSFMSDRLPAISGIAAAIHSSASGNYLAGQWSNFLLRGMAWFTDSTERFYNGWSIRYSSLRHDRYYAPSWSWASVTGPVSFWAHSDPILEVELEEIDFEPQSGNPYGPAKRSSIIMSGRLTPVTVKKVFFREDLQRRMVSGFRVFIANQPPNFPNKLDYLGNPDVSEENYYSDDELYYLLFLYRFSQDRPDSLPRGGGVGLILRKVRDERDTYERVASVLYTTEEYVRCVKITVLETFVFI